MIPGGKIITVLIVVLVAMGRGYADMVPISGLDTAQQPVARMEAWTGPPRGECRCPPVGYGLAGREWEAGRFLPLDESSEEAAPIYILANHDNSLGLCVYALLSLGLCKAVPSIRRLSFGIFPDWFACGGPFQIGHSYAAAPDCRCPVVACFVQPDGSPEDPAPPYRRERIVSLRRQWQFIPTLLAPRGPPRDDLASSFA